MSSVEVRRATKERAGSRFWARFWEDEVISMSGVVLSSQDAKTSGDGKLLTGRGW